MSALLTARNVAKRDLAATDKDITISENQVGYMALMRSNFDEDEQLSKAGDMLEYDKVASNCATCLRTSAASASVTTIEVLHHPRDEDDDVRT